MSPDTSILLLITFWASVQDGLGVPVMTQLDMESRDDVPPHKVRTKRCSCSNRMDSECHYFCHLDIIWINTPSKTTAYGLGNPPSRRRRSASRCTCANPCDLNCNKFCINSHRKRSAQLSLKTRQMNILHILRTASIGSRQALNPPDSDKPCVAKNANAR